MHSISVTDLSKTFRLYERPQDRLKELLLRRSFHRDFDVLKDISFDVLEGRSLGIIGDNGAGKSTLLKLMVGTLQPTAGDIDIRGKVAALLELGAGFHPEFSGRRNIYLNASLLGVPDDDIGELEAEIIDFAELHDFIDQPVKTYSSGMYVRLAFSIATLVRPDILVVDEALAVGDMAFQKKCIRRMNQFRAEHKTMVFCSHSMYHVQELCDTALWLEKGRIREIGPSLEVVSRYEDYSKGVTDNGPSYDSTAQPQIETHNSGDFRILYARVVDEEGRELNQVEPLQDLMLEMEFEALNDDVDCYFGFALMQNIDEFLTSYMSSNYPDVPRGPYRKGERVRVKLRLSALALRVGRFHVLAGISEESGLLWYETKLSQEIEVRPRKGLGPLLMPAHWQVERDR